MSQTIGSSSSTITNTTTITTTAANIINTNSSKSDNDTTIDREVKLSQDDSSVTVNDDNVLLDELEVKGEERIESKKYLLIEQIYKTLADKELVSSVDSEELTDDENDEEEGDEEGVKDDQKRTLHYYFRKVDCKKRKY
ncbi:hypothetical protein ABK040_007733 [Willaertia magna]